MRGKICDNRLTNAESCAKDPRNKDQYLMVCSTCMAHSYQAEAEYDLSVEINFNTVIDKEDD